VGYTLTGGRPSKPAHQRRNASAATPGVTVLPAGGRAGDPPPWPLASETLGEEAKWLELWATPQAVMWERMGAGVVGELARYTRMFCAAVAADHATVATAHRDSEIRQLADRYGLSPLGMMRLHWAVEEAETAGREAVVAPVRRIRAVE